MNKYPSKQCVEVKIGTYRVVWRFNGPNKHAQTIQRAQDSVSIEQEGSNQGNGVLTYR